MNIYTKEFLRIQALDKCFRDRSRNYFIDDLIIACNKAVREHYPEEKNVRKRTIYEDIAKMNKLEGFSEAIDKTSEYDLNQDKERDFIHPGDLSKNSSKGRRKEAYRYSDSSFEFSHSNLNELELGQVKEALSILSRIKGRQEFKALNEIIPKIRKDIMNDEELPDILSYDDNEDLVGVEYLDALIDGIKENSALKIKYQPYQSEVETVIIFPYHLRQYNKRWFLFANRKDRPELSYLPIFSIDRIKSVIPCHPEKEAFVANNVEIKEYLRNVIGVSNSYDWEPQNIFLKFHPNRYHYVKTKPLHHSQRHDDNNCSIQIRVVLNRELEQLILSFGADVKVVAPADLQNRLHQLSKKMSSNYEGKEVSGNTL